MAVKIKMRKSIPGSDDGIVSQLYMQGEVYEVSDKLADSFIKARFAEKVSADVVEQIKAIPIVPENKTLIPEAENKADEEKTESILAKGFGKSKKKDKE